MPGIANRIPRIKFNAANEAAKNIKGPPKITAMTKSIDETVLFNFPPDSRNLTQNI